MISREEHVMCPWCYESNKLGEWNDNTYAQCKNREQRRDFVELTNEKVFGKNSTAFFLCPSCGKWSRGNHLRLVDTNESNLLNLGGKNLIKYIHNDNAEDDN